MMRLTGAKVVAVVPVVDLERAKCFYRDRLGMEVDDGEGDGVNAVAIKCGDGTGMVLYAGHTPAMTSQTQWRVPDIERAVDELRRQGIIFETYDGLATDEQGIAEADGVKYAWFRDPEGNILCLSETPH